MLTLYSLIPQSVNLLVPHLLSVVNIHVTGINLPLALIAEHYFPDEVHGMEPGQGEKGGEGKWLEYSKYYLVLHCHFPLVVEFGMGYVRVEVV